MKYILDNDPDQAQDATVGGKAQNLFRLRHMGITVPRFVVIPAESLAVILSSDGAPVNRKAIQEFIQGIDIPDGFIHDLASSFPKNSYFAVRSSATDEDGTDFSFAGQFESYLYVSEKHLAEKIKQVWCSGFAERVWNYRMYHNLVQRSGIAVIVQEMVDADVAGVAFGESPVKGNKDEKLVSALYGLGEGLVSGDLDADHFRISGPIIEADLAEKTHQISFNRQASEGTIKTEVPAEMQKISSLPDHQIHVLAGILDKLHAALGKPQDVEFAIQDDQLFILQTRPITTFKTSASRAGAEILWDNSNVIESYPGVTTPLTFSFISKSYQVAYMLFSAYLGVSEQVIKENERVFANTLGFLNGRVYYNLKTWYHMLAMLPGYSINARFMEKMMGVKERFDIPETYRLSKGKAWWRIVKMAVKMYFRFVSLPQKRRQFMLLVDQTIGRYRAISYPDKNAGELMALYLQFEQTLLNEWKAPLLNDFFAMIWFGRLQKQCEKYLGGQNQNIHNDLLCGSNDIISVQPVHRSIELASRISADATLKEIFLVQNEADIWAGLVKSSIPEAAALKTDIDQYLIDFGERCVGELKLETVSYTQDPTKFIRILKSYVETGITSEQFAGNREDAIREHAQLEIDRVLKGNFYKKWKLNRIVKNARELVSARENLRYERTRAFGIVRKIFTFIGMRFYSDGIIASERDIFYLTKEEIFSYIEGTSVTQNLKKLIAIRKNESENYRRGGALSERFATYGAPYNANDFFNTDRIEKPGIDLKGIGCSPGKVTGKVKVVLNPGEVSSLNGDILITSSTDPGWVTLFPGALGIIVERGSLLSHSAIVSREMGKPCIVSVTGLLKTLKTGDEIEMDGSTGLIRIISQ